MFSSVVGVFGFVVVGFMCNLKLLGWKYIMVIGVIVIMVFFFVYIVVCMFVENVGFSCVIFFILNIYYGICKLVKFFEFF